MKRQCPACSRNTIPVSGLIVSHADCVHCHSLVGVHWLFAAGFFVVIFAVTLVSTLAVLAQQGVYAALIWLPFPIGALGYVKARFCPLEVKAARKQA